MKNIFSKIVLWVIFSIFISIASNGQTAVWKTIKPTNTGITGEHVHFGKFDPEGNLWVGARWPFWSEGGVAKFDGTKWKAYSNVDSWMPTDYINCIAFQPNGVAWIGTDAGLIRFNGITAQVFNMSNAPFPSNNISNVTVDGTGNVWFISKEVNTTAHGVIKFDGTNWTVYNSSNSGIPYFDITSIGIDLNNHLWVGTWAMGIAKYDGINWTAYNSSNGFSAGPVTSFAFPQDQSVWVTASQMGIFKFSNNAWQNVPALTGNHDYSTVASHPDGTLWFGTYGGLLVKYDGNFTPYLYGNHLYSIDFDVNGDVWAGGLANIKKYVNGVNTLTYNVSNTSLTSYFVDGIDFASDGKAWFATSMGGVCSYDTIKWDGFNPDNAGSQPWTFVHNSANDVFVDNQNGNVWVASNGVGYWDGFSWNIYTLQNSNIPDNYVNTVTKDISGRIWIGTQGGGAAYFDGSNWTRLNFGSLYTSNTIKAIAVSPDSSVWFASDNGLHKTSDGITYTTFFPANSGLPSSYINAIAFTPGGTMWVATSNGLAKLTGSVWTIYKKSNSGIPANFISDVIITTQGSIWVAGHNTQTSPYYGGISKFDGINWTKFMYGNSPLTHYQIEKLKIDPSGNLWLSTYSEGLMVYKENIVLPENLLSFNGEKKNQFVYLFWKTSFTHNFRQFIIERSSNSHTFEAIGVMEAAQNGMVVNSHSFVDSIPKSDLNEISYYRLKCINYDGSYTYSKIIKITTIKSPIPVVYPNPASSSIRVSLLGKKEILSIKIFDSQGMLINELLNKKLPVTMNVANLKTGLYLIHFSDGKTTWQSRFIKTP